MSCNIDAADEDSTVLTNGNCNTSKVLRKDDCEVLKDDENWLPKLRRTFGLPYYKKCLELCCKERKTMGAGNSPHMMKMYSYWMESLQETFNRTLYADFRKTAVDDANRGDRYGLQCLFRFYSYGLEKNFHPELYDDFQYYTKYDFESGNTYGLEKFYAFLYYRKVNTLLEIDETFLNYLSRFKSLEDFIPLSDTGSKDKQRTIYSDRQRLLLFYREVNETSTDFLTGTSRRGYTRVIVVRNLNEENENSVDYCKKTTSQNSNSSENFPAFQSSDFADGSQKYLQRSKPINCSPRSRSIGRAELRRSRSSQRLNSIADDGNYENLPRRSQSLNRRNDFMRNNGHDTDLYRTSPFKLYRQHPGYRSRESIFCPEPYQERPSPSWTHRRPPLFASPPILQYQNRSSSQQMCPDPDVHPTYKFDNPGGGDKFARRPEIYPYPILAHPYIVPCELGSRESRAGGDKYTPVSEPFLYQHPVATYAIMCPEPNRHPSRSGGDVYLCHPEPHLQSPGYSSFHHPFNRVYPAQPPTMRKYSPRY